ncbi:MAG TPA: hypothetical protein VF832_16760 [Longimicrobiales bacterium]
MLLPYIPIDPPLTREQIEGVVGAVARWIRVAFEDRAWREGEKPHGASSDDAQHSRLLRRLLAGQDALPEAPPRMMAHPGYDFAEGNEVRCLSVRGYGPGGPAAKAPAIAIGDVAAGDSVIIDEALWEVVDRDDDALIVRWPGTNWLGWLAPAGAVAGLPAHSLVRIPV